MNVQLIRLLLLILLGLTCPLNAIRAECQERYTPNLSLKLGSFFAIIDTTLRVDSSLGQGTEIHLEDLMKFDRNKRVLQIQGSWQLSQRFHLEAEYHRMTRTSNFIKLEEDIQVSDVIFEAGSTLDGIIKKQLWRFNIYYDLIHTKRLNLGPYFGLNVASNNYKLETRSGEVQKEASTDINELVPSFGLFSTLILHPKLYLNVGLDYFPYSLTDFKSFTLANFETYLEYYPTRHIGLGIAYDYHSVKIESDQGVFLGKLKTRTSGFFAYVILRL